MPIDLDPPDGCFPDETLLAVAEAPTEDVLDLVSPIGWLPFVLPLIAEDPPKGNLPDDREDEPPPDNLDPPFGMFPVILDPPDGTPLVVPELPNGLLPEVLDDPVSDDLDAPDGFLPDETLPAVPEAPTEDVLDLDPPTCWFPFDLDSPDTILPTVLGLLPDVPNEPDPPNCWLPVVLEPPDMLLPDDTDPPDIDPLPVVLEPPLDGTLPEILDPPEEEIPSKASSAANLPASLSIISNLRTSAGRGRPLLSPLQSLK